MATARAARDWAVGPVRQSIAAVYSKSTKGQTGFLDLPGEVRNVIYEYILLFPDSLKIAFAVSSGTARLHHQVGDSNEHLYGVDKDLRPCHVVRPEDLNGTTNDTPAVLLLASWASGDLVRVYLPVLAILRTCKQVYAEAAPLFYSGNDFTIGHVHHKFPVIDPADMAESRVKHDKGDGPMKAGALWLKSLGPHINNVGLNNINVDLEAVCPGTCWASKRNWADKYTNTINMLDLTPLMLVAWGRNHPFELGFLTGDPDQPAAQARTHCLCDFSYAPCEINTRKLSEMVSLLNADELMLRRFKHRINLIMVHRGGRFAIIKFKPSITDEEFAAIVQKERPAGFPLKDQKWGNYVDRTSDHKWWWGNYVDRASDHKWWVFKLEG